MKKVEVYILSGFLGSGKTTLLQNLLIEEKARGRKVAVLMNEFGDFSVDTNLIGDQTPLKELLKGCICCTMKDEVEIQLLSLYQEHKPDVIYIETTGVAHPIEVLDACISPVIAPYIEMKSIITVLDLTRWQQKEKLNPQYERLLVEQVRHGDNLILNKSDLLSVKELERVKEDLKEVNPFATIHMTNYSHVDLSQITQRDSTFDNKKEEVHAKKHLQVQTMTYQFTVPIEMESLIEWLKNMPDSIFRVKGFVKIASDPNGTYVVQYAYGVPTYMKEPINFPTNIVIIGSNLNKEEIYRELNQLEQSNSNKLSVL
ncbi:GTP-binding protein [Cytobacillus spongiae]|uniref:CobW family GTP-binding protein n=1 Tax=Cytobacillus spongiae TaxID=2901381 RepID=UPI001F3820FE|nr:GTP-binding protein [Cytobacillus spongiae]UII56252.1 GTP-binding protein [Cytobacillus spongiae]